MSDEDENFFSSYYGGEELITIATGSPIEKERAPAIASVVTARDIKRLGATNLSEALRHIPGLHVSYSPAAYNPTYIIRGNYSEFNPHVLTLVNNIPITNIFLGNRGQSWGDIPVHNIQRIEVIRGPGSALFGADAFSGVINVITKGPQDIDGTTVGVRGGSFSTREVWAMHGHRGSHFDTALAINYFETEGERLQIEADGQTLFDALFGTSASRAPGSVNNGRNNFDAKLEVASDIMRVRLGYEKRRGGPGVGGQDALDTEGEGESERISADLTITPDLANPALDVSAQLSYFDVTTVTDLVLAPPGATFPTGSFPEGVRGRPSISERHFRLDMEAFYRGWQHHRVRFGGGVKREELYDVKEKKNFLQQINSPFPTPLPGGFQEVSNTSPFITEEKREVVHVSIQDEWILAPDWILTSGLRVDWYSDFGTTVNPRLALVWQNSYELTTKVLYGRAFRPPSFAESFNVNNPVALGNNDLDPETIDTLEVVLDWKPSDEVSTVFNIYYYMMKDILRFVPEPAPSPARRAENTGKRRGFGTELELNWQISKSLKVYGNYSYQNTKDLEENSNVGFAPTHLGYLRLDWEPKGPWVFSSHLYHIADRKRAAGDARSQIDDYTLLDWTGRYFFSERMSATVMLKNVMNQDAYEPTGNALALPHDLPLPGRQILIELQQEF